MTHILRLAFALGALIALVGASQAQTYPAGPLRIVVPFAAGGAIDTVARLIGQRLGEQLKQPVVIENRPGAGGNVGTDAVAKAPPDGYTLLLTTNGHAISPSLYRKLPYDPVRDFAPVTQLHASTLILVASKKLPAQSFAEMVALAKAKPAGLSYGSTGVGNPLHLTMEMLKLQAGIDVIGVPYRGDAPLLTALTAGEIDMAVTPLPTTRPHIEAGNLRALGVTGGKRNPAVPDVPTIAEQGVAGFDSASWHGFLVPAQTPREIVQRLYEESKKVLEVPEVRQRLAQMGIEPVGSPPDAFAALIKRDMERFAEVVKKANIPQQD
jgi:tripartite-type tricarboxylate transporter receptor subunit TctC